MDKYVEINKINEKVNNEMFNFITKASELVDLSEDDYQIEKTIEFNKISLKSYILESPCCLSLYENNITDYSIDDLKSFLAQYEETFHEDLTKYYLALSLYEMLEEIERLVNQKIELEISEVSRIFSDIKNIKDIESNRYESLYLEAKNKVEMEHNGNNIDDRAYNVYMQLLNDIFNFYIDGYPNIPDEYLYYDKN